MNLLNSQLKNEETKRFDLESQLQKYIRDISTVKISLDEKQKEYDNLNKSNSAFFEEQDKIQGTIRGYENTIRDL